jgi:hypothetical protein
VGEKYLHLKLPTWWTYKILIKPNLQSHPASCTVGTGFFPGGGG